MPREMITLKLTEAERSLLNKRAKKNGLTVADYLRVAMVMEAFTAGDLGAVKILGEAIRVKVARAFATIREDARVTA